MNNNEAENLYKSRINELEQEKDELEKVIKAYESLGVLTQKELEESHNLVTAYKKVHDLSRKEMMTLKRELGDFNSIYTHLENQIIQILDEDSGNEQYIMHKLNLLQHKSGDDFFVDLFKVLINLEFPAEEARKYWNNIINYKKDLSKKAGREINFRVAMLDYFINENKKIKNPKIIEIRFYEKTMKFALIDELTGLFNRKYYEDIIDKELNRASRYNRFLSLAVLDIDDFKNYNDKFGHLTGDRVLEKFGEVLKKCLRKEDIICRYGGEEFIVVMPEIDGEPALLTINRIRKELSNYKFQENNIITFSAGIAVFPKDADNKEELFIKADKAMYSAKANGKDQVCLYGHERRGKKRINVDWPVSYSLLKIENGKYIKDSLIVGLARDISLEGICFETDKPLKVGNILKLNFDVNKENPELDKTGKVVWVKKTNNNENYSVGLKFI